MHGHNLVHRDINALTQLSNSFIIISSKINKAPALTENKSSYLFWAKINMFQLEVADDGNLKKL